MEVSPAPPPLTIAPEPSPDQEAMRAIEAGLSAHSAQLGLTGDWTPHWILGRDPDGAVEAGIKYLLAFDWLFVNWLWVGEPYRR